MALHSLPPAHSPASHPGGALAPISRPVLAARELRSIARHQLPDGDSLSRALSNTGRLLEHGRLLPEAQCHESAGLIRINDLALVAMCGAGLRLVLEPSANVTVVACFSSSRHVSDPMGKIRGPAGGALLLPIGTGPRCLSSSSLTSVALMNFDPLALDRAAAAMTGQAPDVARIRPCFSLFPLRALGPQQARPLHSLLRHIDDCSASDPALPGRLGLDDVVMRMVVGWLNPKLLAGPDSESPSPDGRLGRSMFDELIDYIRANLDQPLRLSDLEARSFYSRRALQYAFRRHFGTTPMQWIREQRLSLAMETLQSQPRRRLTIQAVALASGYRQTSQFSADFRRRFGMLPSQVQRPSLL